MVRSTKGTQNLRIIYEINEKSMAQRSDLRIMWKRQRHRAAKAPNIRWCGPFCGFRSTTDDKPAFPTVNLLCSIISNIENHS